jgi:hypothetical protein
MAGKPSAADAALPETADAVPETPAAVEAAPPPETVEAPPWGLWRYDGPAGRIYTNIPATVATGDIVAWPVIPATDGAWTSTTEPANKLPDNHRPESAADVAKEG